MQRNWRYQTSIFAYCHKFFAMDTEFGSMWICDFDSISAVQTRIDLNKTDSRPIHSVLYGGWQRTRKFEEEIMEVVIAYRRYLTYSGGMGIPDCVFLEGKDSAIHFSVECWKSNAATIQDGYLVLQARVCIDSLGDSMIFRTLNTSRENYHIKIVGNNPKRTTCPSHHGFFRYIRTTFGF